MERSIGNAIAARSGTIVLVALVALAALQGCASYSVVRSDSRGPNPVGIELTGNLRLTATGEVDSVFNGNRTLFFPSSFRLEAGNRIIYIDPVAVDANGHADLILLTHGHADHLSLPDLRRLAGANTTIVCPAGAAKGLDGFRLRIVRPGESFSLDGIGIEAVPAYNLRSIALGLKAHPKRDGNVGYIIDVAGTRVYHAGDTDALPELAGLRNIDVALVPISGDKLTMTAEEAAELVKRLRPTFAVPMHFDLGSDAFSAFSRAVDGNVAIADLRGAPAGGR